jgi:putative hydrolase of the HAD superfamily
MNNNKYKTLFFDLDHTLWDYNRSAAETLTDLYKNYGLESLVAFTPSELCQRFFEINFQLWADYNVGKIDSQFLRTQRFRLIFESLGTDPSLLPKDFGSEYTFTCPTKPHLIDGALDLLNDLKDRFHLHIITNGFEDVQHTKVKSAGLLPYFDEVITSERAGGKKPGKAIFEYSLGITGSRVENSLMIGDNLQTDIAGARNMGMDQVFFNPENLDAPFVPSYTVAHLSEITSCLQLQ